MKKVIDGKLYNTETAESVACNEPYYDRGNFNWFSETLYRTKKGSWFLFGDGNANSPYSRQCDSNSYMGDTEIIPYSDEEARNFCEHYGAPSTYEKYWPLEEA